MPRAGGMDDQPAERLAHMQFAERWQRMEVVKAQSDNWAVDCAPYQDLINLLAELDDDG